MRSNELAERTLPLPAREALLMRTLLNHPWLLEARCEEVAELDLDLARRSPACAMPCSSSLLRISPLTGVSCAPN